MKGNDRGVERLLRDRARPQALENARALLRRNQLANQLLLPALQANRQRELQIECRPLRTRVAESDQQTRLEARPIGRDLLRIRIRQTQGMGPAGSLDGQVARDRRRHGPALALRVYDHPKIARIEFDARPRALDDPCPLFLRDPDIGRPPVILSSLRRAETGIGRPCKKQGEQVRRSDHRVLASVSV